jgi:type IV pilus assembly protein PilP
MRTPRSLPLAALLLAACSSAPAPSTLATSHAALAADPAPREPSPQHAAPALLDTFDAEAITATTGRDPFHAYAPAPPPPSSDTRPRKAKRYGVDQLTLVGVVTSTALPRAVLVDPRGKGWIVTPGEIVGRPEKLGGGEALASWRVDRIRGRDVVLVREDSPGVPGATRVLSMAQEAVPEDD